MKKISVCIPCYNEESNIVDAYHRVKSVLEGINEYQYEIIFADNASTDYSQHIIYDLVSKDEKVKAIFNAKNVGAGPSGTNCLLRSTGDAAILIPCDMQDPPELIPSLIREWEKGSLVVLGCKTESKESSLMYAIRGLYYKVLDGLSDNEVFHQADGFGLYDRTVLEASRSYCDKNRGLKSFVSLGIFPVSTVQYAQQERKEGRSSYSLVGYCNLAFNNIIENSTKVFNYLFGISILLFGVNAIGFLVLLLYKITSTEPLDSGMNIFIPVVFCFVSVQLIVSSLVGAYVARINQKTKSVPLVIEQESYGL